MKRRIIVFSMLLAAMLLTSNLYAQEKQGGLFGKDWFSGIFSSDDAEELEAEEYQGLFTNNTREGNGPQWSDGIGNQGFNQTPESPLGSGVIMLIAAGAGYAVLKRKQEKN